MILSEVLSLSNVVKHYGHCSPTKAGITNSEHDVITTLVARNNGEIVRGAPSSSSRLLRTDSSRTAQRTLNGLSRTSPGWSIRPDSVHRRYRHLSLITVLSDRLQEGLNGLPLRLVREIEQVGPEVGM